MNTRTPAQPFQRAVARADAGWLSCHVDARTCPLEQLRCLLAHESEALRDLGLTLLAERACADSSGEAAEQADLLDLVPGPHPGHPERALAAAGLYERLGPYLGGRPWPAWRDAGLPEGVRVAWLRAELLNEPALAGREAPGEPLHQAVHSTDARDAHRPEELVRELARSADPVLRAETLRLVRQGLHAGVLAPSEAREQLAVLLEAEGTGSTAGDILRELTEPWAALDPLPERTFASFLAAGQDGAAHPAAGAALAAAAHHGHDELLRAVATDPDRAPRLRQRAMELLGERAERGDIGELTAVALRDPLLFGNAATACLRALHRRGHFPAGADVPSVVGLALADVSVPADDVATVLYTCRTDTVRLLADAPMDDPSWPRRLELLTALARQGVDARPIGEVVTATLSLTHRPAPFLEAIRALRYTDAEETVIAVLRDAPAMALETLEAIGGERTVQVLAEGLGLPADPDDPSVHVVAPHLRAVRHRALELLWHLNRDPRRRRSLLRRLDPADLPARVAPDLGAPDEDELAVLRAHVDPSDPVAALCRLAAHGGAGTVPAIADLLLRVVGELAAAHEPGSSEERAAEPFVPEAVADALRATGRRLYGRAKIRPACLLDAHGAEEAGHAFVAGTVLDLLDRPGLSDGEQAVLLELLRRCPYKGTRPRVHRLLRHRDRHVRKHVIALLTQDAAGDGALALSASLISLTAAPDVQTVRQALTALGQARARWACGAIAACLGHPVMNIRKTAAAALVRAGAPEAVPALLYRLGRSDNPGLRDTLVEALHAVLGDAYAATLLAAAEGTEDTSARTLLLSALDGLLSARSLVALGRQGSVIVPSLLALVASGRVALSSGTPADLAALFAAHGVDGPASPGPGVHDTADADAVLLVSDGWNTAVALRLAGRAERPGPARLRELRPLLADWLHLAETVPETRRQLLGLVLRLCPAPWPDDERAVLVRHAGVFIDALPGSSGEERDALVAILETVVPDLPPARRQFAAAAVRMPAGELPGAGCTLPLLRASGAVVGRADVDRDLAAAGVAADPDRAAVAVLREAFAVERPSGTAPAGAWHAALGAALRTPDALEAFWGERADAPGSREVLGALIDAWPTAAPGVRDALLDRMTRLQPLDAPEWTLTETAAAAPPPARSVRADDLDQPRSSALFERLTAMLSGSDPHRRDEAARRLLAWPDPHARMPVLRAFLRGRVTVPVLGLRDLGLPAGPELRSGDILPDRVLLIARELGAWELVPLIPVLLEWWEQGPSAARRDAALALRRVPADVLADALGERLGTGAWGVLDLLPDPLLRTPALTRVITRLRAEGHDEAADGLHLVDGPLRGPDAAREDAAALAALRERAPVRVARRDASRRELFDIARNGTPEQIRRALTRLAEDDDATTGDGGQELTDVIGQLLGHRERRVRLHAHRISRTLLDRETHLHHTSLLLDDPQADVKRMAIRVLCRARWAPAVPAVTALLDHAHPVVRRAAAEGLVSLGEAAVPTLTHAAARARPDRRRLYTDVLDRIELG
ncbi:HEAT repeat domain-containing protein [Streptomyces sp. NPDC058572]|uniref:HEAT repeat domain-containing protein n=1 Tax=Streptomyces sp. NPDC058572 TaxID=3346546 RepID=UPI003647853E